MDGSPERIAELIFRKFLAENVEGCRSKNWMDECIVASLENVRVRMDEDRSVLMNTARQSIRNCCQNAKLGRAVISVDENVILKCTFDEFLDTCSKMMIELSRCSPVISKAVD